MEPGYLPQGLPLADRFFCNRNELRAALDYMSATSPEELLRDVSTIISTLGGGGSLVFTGKAPGRYQRRDRAGWWTLLVPGTPSVPVSMLDNIMGMAYWNR